MRLTYKNLIAVLSLSLAGCAGGIIGNGSGTGTKSPEPESGQLVISPASATLRGLATQSFSASEAGVTAAPNVTWSVNGIPGGNAVLGTISVAGSYAAPEFPPNAAITISATETTDSSKTAASAITLDNPIPQVAAVLPASISVGAFTLTVSGAHFAPGAAIQFGTSMLPTTRASSTMLTATGTATTSQVGTIPVVVQNPNPGSISSAALTAKVVGNNNNGNGNPSPEISLAISPATATVRPGINQYFSVVVTGTTNTAVTWSLNNLPTGSATIGYVSPLGTDVAYYAPPANVPTPNTLTVTVVSNADPTKKATSTITLVNPTPTVTSVTPGSIGVGAFMLTVTGTRFVNGATVNFGGHPLTTMFVSPTELNATGSALASQAGNVAITVTNPNPGSTTSTAVTAQVVNAGPAVSAAAAVRFLEQSTFGPTPALANQVQQTGFDTFLQSQFSAPSSAYPTPADTDTDLTNVQNVFFKNAVNDSDQLRQRMAFALNEIWVVGENKVSDPTGYTNYMTVLTRDGLGNYYNVMKDVSLTPAMGHWQIGRASCRERV